jgi:hypothetical protein
MSRFDSATVAASAFGAGILLITVTGCAQIDNLLSRQHEETFTTYAQAERDWVGVDIPHWIPDDATELRNLATFDETIAVIRVVTDSELAGDCVADERVGIPALDVDWSTQDWPDEVQRCGDYEVIPMDDGWLGWFNATEEGQTPN